MFFLRGLAAMLSVFLIAYVLLSCAVALSWRWMARILPHQTSVSSARSLYWLRTAPLFGAVAVAVFYELPSFLYFEPKGAEELLNGAPLWLSLAALIFGAVGVWRMISVVRRTERLCRTWTSCEEVFERNGLLVSRTNASGPPVAIVGIRKAKLLLSPNLYELLSDEEMERTVAHEHAHVIHGDNLRKVGLQLCRFPGMSDLEEAWAEAVEFAADEKAVSSKREALALASALVKISALKLPAVDSTLAVTHFVGTVSSTVRRVQRLTEWRESPKAAPSSLFRSSFLAVLSGLVLALSYGPALGHLHSLTEALFR